MHILTYIIYVLFTFLKSLFYLFLERGEGREKEGERNINVWLPLMCPPPGNWPTTQACDLTGDQSRDPLALRLALNPLSHTSWGIYVLLKLFIFLGSFNLSLGFSPSSLNNMSFSTCSSFSSSYLTLGSVQSPSYGV